jgi:chromosome segregation ATPase
VHTEVDQARPASCATNAEGCHLPQEQELERCKLELQEAKRAGAKVLDDAAAMQAVRLAEAQLSKMALKLSHAQTIQATYRALVAQLDKDKAQVAAQLDGVADTLSRAEGEAAKLRNRERASSTRRSEASARLQELRAGAAQKRAEDATQRVAKAAAVDQAASDCAVRANSCHGFPNDVSVPCAVCARRVACSVDVILRSLQ